TSVHLNSGIGSWGVTPDENGVIELYAEIGIREDAVEALDLLALSYLINNGTLVGNSATIAGVTYDFHLPYTLPTPMTCDGGEGGYFYLTYRALFDGTHHILIESQTGNGNTFAKLSLMDMQGNERPLNGLGDQPIALLAQTELDVEMQKGEVLLVRCYYESTPEAADYLSISAALPATISQVERSMPDVFTMLHNAMDIRLYNGAEAGIIALPVYPDKNINGWKYTANGAPSTETLTRFTSAMLNKGDWFIHSDLELSAIILYPTDEEALAMLEGWLGTILAGREYDSEKLLSGLGEMIDNVTIPASGSATFVWFWLGALNSNDFEAMIGSVGNASLHFEQGLPAGTTLSLVDFAPAILGGYPIYYYYIVQEDNVTDIPLSHFVALGERSDSEKRFGGFSPAMIFNVSYQNTPKTLTEENISLVTDIGVADFSFALSLQQTREEVLSEQPLTLELGTPMEGTLPLYSLADRGYGEDDIVLLTMHLTDANGSLVRLPVNFAAGEDILILNGMAGIPLGTVGYLNGIFEAAQVSVLPVPITLDFDALRYHGFTGTVHLELIVIPAYLSLSYDNLSYLGVDTFVDTRYQVPVRLSDAPQISFAEQKG
ncbi:MAG: hypothetical protein IKZ16_04950, partial [Clostridia bacterium]|nr:hypothetical protein [Clostridia bacterium]